MNISAQLDQINAAFANSPDAAIALNLTNALRQLAARAPAAPAATAPNMTAHRPRADEPAQPSALAKQLAEARSAAQRAVSRGDWGAAEIEGRRVAQLERQLESSRPAA